MPIQVIGYIYSSIVKEDTVRWRECYGLRCCNFTAYLYFLTFYKEFRNLVYKRLHISSFITPPHSSLFLTTKEIGAGLFIQHGFATVVSAKKIGVNCWINQQVTIGHSNKTDAPIIGNNVKILAGAIVIGDITIGDNAVIGVGAVVVDNVPPNSVVCGPKAKVIKIDGQKV